MKAKNVFGSPHRSGKSGRYTGQPTIATPLRGSRPSPIQGSYHRHLADGVHPPKPHGPANAAPPRKPNSKLGTYNAIPKCNTSAASEHGYRGSLGKSLDQPKNQEGGPRGSLAASGPKYRGAKFNSGSN